MTLSTAAIFLYGGKLVIDGAITTGTLVALMSYHLRLLSPVQNLMSLYSNLVSGGVSLSRVWELFDTRADIIDCPGAQPLETCAAKLSSTAFHLASAAMRYWKNYRFELPREPFAPSWPERRG